MTAPDEVMDLPPEEDEFGYPIFDPLEENNENDFCFLCTYDIQDEADEDMKNFKLFLDRIIGKFSIRKTIDKIYEYYNEFLRNSVELTSPVLQDLDSDHDNILKAPEWTRASIKHHFLNDSNAFFNFQFAMHIETNFAIMDVCRKNMLDKTGKRVDPSQAKLYQEVFKNTVAIWNKHNT